LDGLESDLLKAVAQIGQLVGQQTEAIRDDLRADIANDALAQAKTAETQLYTYESLGLQGALIEANTLSSEASERILLENDPYYIGPLIVAGNVRIDIVRALDPQFYAQAVWLNEISRLADHLEMMIGTIIQRVQASHTIVRDRELRGPPADETGGVPHYRYFWAHRHHGIVLEKFTTPGPEHLGALDNAARQRALQARQNGIDAELQYLQVPRFSAIAETWRRTPAEHIFRQSVRKCLVRTVNALDRVLALRPLFDVTYPRRLGVAATAEEEFRDGNNEASGHSRGTRPTVSLVTDTRPFILRIVSSPEFLKSFVEPAQEPEAIVKLAVTRLLEREPDQEEAQLLMGVLKRLGLSALVVEPQQVVPGQTESADGRH
jgi:hypothetical protein